ncbi:MAG: hypothetical protein IPK04_11030 [Bdellovibrionales bacterium]|nr:hypothetical protein [Bdellovibrionales bacterium]
MSYRSKSLCAVFFILAFSLSFNFSFNTLMAAGDGLVSNEYHLILGPNAPYNPELSQNEIVKKIQSVLVEYALTNSWQIRATNEIQVRDISFFESVNGDLGKNSLILRKRGRLDKNAWTLKRRQTEAFDKDSVFKGAKVPLKVKQERDIQWIKSGQQFTTFSESGNFEMQTDFTNSGQILSIFPALKDATNLPKSEPVSRILPVPIAETVYNTIELVEPSTKTNLTFETIFWTVQNCRNRIIEVSVKQMDGKDKEEVEAAIQEIYNLFPAQDTQVSKTRLINSICGDANP